MIGGWGGARLTLCAVVLLSTPAAAYMPGAGLAGTPHDWTESNATGGLTVLLYSAVDSRGNVTPVTTNTGVPYIDPATGRQGTTKIKVGLCTTCHTPMSSRSSDLLWNHTLPRTTYAWDVPSTTAGTKYPSFRGDSYRGPSAKCMSCHDGTLAAADGLWFNGATLTGSLPASVSAAGHAVASAGGSMAGTHPVAMPYPYQGIANTYNGTFNGAQTAFSAFVSDPTSTGIRLFNDDGAGNITAGARANRSGIECTSCHDVHNGARTKDQLLLAGMRSGGRNQGYICTQCHKS